MMKKPQWFAVLVTAVMLFTLSSLVHSNDVCCMFSAVRAYGFPAQFLTLSKETDVFEEAQKVHTLSTPELLRQGWQFRFVTTTSSGFSQSAALNLVVNALLCFAVSLIGVYFVARIV